MTDAPKETIAAIDTAIAKCHASGWSELWIELSWRLYQDLLAIKGIAWEPSVSPSLFDAKHEDRPIKEFRGIPLILTGCINTVLTKLDDGRIQGWVIVTR